MLTIRKTLVTSLLLCLASSAVSQDKPAYDALLFEQNLMVPMRDAVGIASDIYRPAINGVPVAEPLPVLLQRTPYDKTGDQLVESARFFASHGYVVVLQDLRGLYQSEGVFTKYIGEGQDGYDAIEYLARLPYANGKVGMWGTSYAAHVQANAAKLKPPHLSTMVLNMGGMSNGWDHKVRNHGAFELQQLTWAFRQLETETTDPVVRAMLAAAPVDDWLRALPLRKGLNPLSVAPNFEEYILTMMTHSDYDDYWKHPDLNWVEHYDATADVPMLLISGWYDSYAGGTIDNYVALSGKMASPVNLIMGPWTHSGNTRAYAGNADFGADAAIADFHHAFHLQWFDHYLKSAEQNRQDTKVRLFIMGGGSGKKTTDGRLDHGGQWRTVSDWPVEGARITTLYFHGDGDLAEAAPAPGDAATTYTFDPADPVPTIGGAFSSTSPVFEPGAYDQRETADIYGAALPYLPLKARNDVLVFQTAPLAKDTEVVGPVVAKLYVASTAPDTDFTVKIVDVYPPSADFPAGYEMNLTDGIVRTRYRNRPDHQEMMNPGDVYEITVTPFPTANLFKKGHRIRVDVSSSNFPRFDINPNTGEPLGMNRRTVPADNTLFHNATYPSHIILPILEGN